MNSNQFRLYMTGYSNLNELLKSKSQMISTMIKHYEYWLYKPDDFFVDHPNILPKMVILDKSEKTIIYQIDQLYAFLDYLLVHMPDNHMIDQFRLSIDNLLIQLNSNIQIRSKMEI